MQRELLSSYLMARKPQWRPAIHLSQRQTSKRPLNIAGRLYALTQAFPAWQSRTWMALGLWAVIFGVGLYATAHQTMPTAPDTVAAADQPMSKAPSPAATLRPAARAAHLPDGPSGQLLPPGTMAPQNTYPNSYMRGQCTWYVAGRRPVPGNWGNARTWFGRAQAAGWATGTTPAVAAIAWTPAGYYGHVTLVEAVDVAGGQVLVSEMNYLGAYRLSRRWVPAKDFKYIY